MIQAIVDTWNQMTLGQQWIIAASPLLICTFVAYCKEDPIK